MQARQFHLLLQRLSSLTRRQRTRLLALLQHTAGLDRALEVIEQTGKPPCPCCHAGNPYRHGHAHSAEFSPHLLPSVQ